MHTEDVEELWYSLQSTESRLPEHLREWLATVNACSPPENDTDESAFMDLLQLKTTWTGVRSNEQYAACSVEEL